MVLLVYAMCAGMIFFSLLSLQRIKRNFEINNKVYAPALAQAAGLTLEISAVQMEFFRYLQEQESSPARLVQFLDRMDVRIAHILKLRVTTLMLTEAQEVQRKLTVLREQLAALQASKEQRHSPEAMKTAGEWLAGITLLAETANSLRDSLWDYLYASDFRSRTSFIRESIIFIIISSVIFVLAAIFVFKVQQDVKQGFQLLQGGIEAMARGERQVFAEITRTDEFGQLARAFNDLSQGLQAREREAQHLQAQLLQAQKMEAVGTLAGGLAHDFNNILTAIQGQAEILLWDKAPEEPGYEELQAIMEACRKVGVLVRQLLTFSRKLPAHPLPVDLNREIKNLSILLARTLPKMIKIELDLAEQLAPVEADSVQLEQMLVNLAVNARDAMPDGGKLIIATSRASGAADSCPDEVRLSPEKYVLLTVTDTGQGMPAEVRNHIFEPFFTTKDIGKGTGLGLAMVYGIVQSHHGYISCSSQPGMGTTFRIYLPVSAAPARTPEAADMETPALPRGAETVLFVDDEEMLRDLGARILANFGYAVRTAATGEEALKLYRQPESKIDLVIVDLIMPGMGGLKCLKQLMEFDPDARVIVVSGFAPDGDADEALAAGARGFLRKPFDVQEMLQLMRRILAERGAPASRPAAALPPV